MKNINEMKRISRLFRMISNKIDMDQFYAISLDYKMIRLQGDLNKGLIRELLSLNFEAESSKDSSFIYFTKGCLTIVLG